ncbi:hypothetical protein [Tardiphaga sp.]|uniref:hypothetical protein n=1 Tax=Tardiphaga sp. TaxID=1926292 RepID=UPI002622A405|nr:hypothetical protein [Tardiphaga sp.]MDB5619504.1 hypothetical protein [Tardiphaga sp.]
MYTATAEQTADVITPNFGATVEKTVAQRATPAHRRRQHADNKLIELCMEVTANMAAADGAFKADPSGNSDFAEAWDDIYRSRANQAMQRATKVKAQTADGLRSKAAVADVIYSWLRSFTCEPEHTAFLTSFTVDVIRMQQAMLQERVSHKKFSDAR